MKKLLIKFESKCNAMLFYHFYFYHYLILSLRKALKNKVFSAFHGAKHNFSNVAKNGQVSNNQGESHTIILALTSTETQLTHENDWIFKNTIL